MQRPDCQNRISDDLLNDSLPGDNDFRHPAQIPVENPDHLPRVPFFGHPGKAPQIAHQDGYRLSLPPDLLTFLGFQDLIHDFFRQIAAKSLADEVDQPEAFAGSIQNHLQHLLPGGNDFPDLPGCVLGKDMLDASGIVFLKSAVGRGDRLQGKDDVPRKKARRVNIIKARTMPTRTMMRTPYQKSASGPAPSLHHRYARDNTKKPASMIKRRQNTP